MSAETADRFENVSWWNRGFHQAGKLPYLLFVVALICLALTLVTTWPLWQDRVDPPNVPLFDGLSGLSFGWLIMVAIGGSLFFPRKGTIAIICLLAVAMAFDLIRCQPQMFAFPFLLAACLWSTGRSLCRWYLIAMWLWAGLHKLLSADWMGPSSWYLLKQMGFDNAFDLYLVFAIGVAVSEIVLALLALFFPRVAAIGCVALHAGIVVMLLSIDWNFSVLYWNVANAAIGCWLLWTWGSESGSLVERIRLTGYPVWQKGVVALLIISPAGIYNGWVPHFLAHVLYSDNLPKPMMASSTGSTEFKLWDALHAPIPRPIPVLTSYFERVGKPGDKLHILDPRPGMPDRYLQLGDTRIARSISREKFWSADGIRGIAKDNPISIFHLQKSEVKLVARKKNGPLFAIEFTPENYSPETFARIEGLLNLEQIQISGCDVGDEDLQSVAVLPLLTGIDLSANPRLSDACLENLKGLKNLRFIGIEGTGISQAAVDRILESR